MGVGRALASGLWGGLISQGPQDDGGDGGKEGLCVALVLCRVCVFIFTGACLKSAN